MRSRNVTRWTFIAAMALATALVPAAPALAGDCTGLSGVITAMLDVNGPEGEGWYGVAYLSVGGGPHVAATLVDHSDGYGRFRVRNNGGLGFSGKELLTFRVGDEDSFLVSAEFSAVCRPEGYSCELHETGKLVPEAGTGRFLGMTGNVSIKGPFAACGNCGPEKPYVWISDVSGAVCSN